MSPSPPLVRDPSDSVEFRVLLRGLKLDETTRALIDASIRSAVLREIAAVDNGAEHRVIAPSDDAETRSLLGSARKILGLVLSKGAQL